MVAGTLLVAAIAALVAIPVGVATAIFLSEYAPDRVRRAITKPSLEVLAGIPTVVYGYFALTFVTPQLQIIFPDMIVFNALSAGLVMGLMIIPDGVLPQRGRDAGGAEVAPGRRLRAWGNAAGGLDQGRRSRRALRHHSLLHPGHLASRR